jgi:hypothetical protein
VIEKIKKNFVITFWLFFSFSVLFFLTESLYKQKKVDDYLIEFKNQNKKIFEKNISQKNDLEFFESKFYKEIYAKENLNLLNNGEKVIIIEKNFLENDFFLKKFLTESFPDDKEFTSYEKWMNFFNLK